MKITMLKYPDGNDWLEIKRRALVTSGFSKVKTIPDTEWKHKILEARHSPIRYGMFSFFIEDIPYYLHTELVRHHIGIEKYVKSQRDDRVKNEVPRAEKPQGALVNMIVDMNCEALMVISNKRLCNKASPEMRDLFKQIRAIVYESCPEFIGLLEPMCVYNTNKCHEMEPCGRC